MSEGEADAKVVRLVDRAAGIAVDDGPVLCAWAREWIGAIEGGEYGQARSLVIVLEREDGRLGVVSQSLRQMDRARIVGLLHMAAQWKADGDAQIDSLRE